MSTQMVATFKPNTDAVWKVRLEEEVNVRTLPILQVLMKHAESGEEGTRNVVAECLGRLCLIDAQTLVPRLAVRESLLTKNDWHCFAE